MPVQMQMVPLTHEELDARGQEQAALELQTQELEQQKDASNREFNAQLKRLRAQIRQIAKEVKEGKVYRQATEDEAPWEPPEPPEVPRRARRARVGVADADQ